MTDTGASSAVSLTVWYPRRAEQLWNAKYIWKI